MNTLFLQPVRSLLVSIIGGLIGLDMLLHGLNDPWPKLTVIGGLVLGGSLLVIVQSVRWIVRFVRIFFS